MAQQAGANQSPRVTTGYLNQSGRTGDPAPGVLVSTSQISGSIVQSYAGQLGGILFISPATATTLSDTTVSSLFSGAYRYVQFLLTSTASNLRGQIVFWNSIDNCIVTPDAIAANRSTMAGITLNSTTKGNYDFIQIAGKANVKFGTITKTTPVAGDAVFVNNTPSNLADVIADATALTAPQLVDWLGVALVNPSSNTVSLVLLRALPDLFYS